LVGVCTEKVELHQPRKGNAIKCQRQLVKITRIYSNIDTERERENRWGDALNRKKYVPRTNLKSNDADEGRQ
jgi:hypothetical protein